MWNCVNNYDKNSWRNIQQTVSSICLSSTDCKNKNTALKNKRLHYCRDPRDALYLLKYWPTAVQITQTDGVSASCEAVSSTAAFYSANCTVLYMHRCTRQNNRTASMRCRGYHQHKSSLMIWQLDHNCDQPTSITNNVVDDTAYFIKIFCIIKLESLGYGAPLFV